MYENGKGVAQDYQKAFSLYALAANEGNSNAQYNLGVMYENGRGIEKNKNKAHEWYFKAAEQGDQDARYHLTLAYAVGELNRAERKKYKNISTDWELQTIEVEASASEQAEAEKHVD